MYICISTPIKKTDISKQNYFYSCKFSIQLHDMSSHSAELYFELYLQQRLFTLLYYHRFQMRLQIVPVHAIKQSCAFHVLIARTQVSAQQVGPTRGSLSIFRKRIYLLLLQAMYGHGAVFLEEKGKHFNGFLQTLNAIIYCLQLLFENCNEITDFVVVINYRV